MERQAEAIRSPQNPTFNPQMLPPEHQRSSAITLHTCSSGIYTASNTSTYDPDYPPAQSINNMTQFVHEYEYSEWLVCHQTRSGRLLRCFNHLIDNLVLKYLLRLFFTECSERTVAIDVFINAVGLQILSFSYNSLRTLVNSLRCFR